MNDTGVRTVLISLHGLITLQGRCIANFPMASATITFCAGWFAGAEVCRTDLPSSRHRSRNERLADSSAAAPGRRQMINGTRDPQWPAYRVVQAERTQEPLAARAACGLAICSFIFCCISLGVGSAICVAIIQL